MFLGRRDAVSYKSVVGLMRMRAQMRAGRLGREVSVLVCMAFCRLNRFVDVKGYGSAGETVFSLLSELDLSSP